MNVMRGFEFVGIVMGLVGLLCLGAYLLACLKERVSESVLLVFVGFLIIAAIFLIGAYS